jgi:hypothetical protein
MLLDRTPNCVVRVQHPFFVSPEPLATVALLGRQVLTLGVTCLMRPHEAAVAPPLAGELQSQAWCKGWADSMLSLKASSNQRPWLSEQPAERISSRMWMAAAALQRHTRHLIAAPLCMHCRTTHSVTCPTIACSAGGAWLTLSALHLRCKRSITTASKQPPTFDYIIIL